LQGIFLSFRYNGPRGSKKSGYKRKRKSASSGGAEPNATIDSVEAAHCSNSKSKNCKVLTNAKRPETRNKFIFEAKGEDKSEYRERCRPRGGCAHGGARRGCMREVG